MIIYVTYYADVLPQYLHKSTGQFLQWIFIKSITIRLKTYPYCEQQPPDSPFGSQIAWPKSLPQRPSGRGAEGFEGAGELEGAAGFVHPETHPVPQ